MIRSPGRPIIASRVETGVQILEHQPRHLSSGKGSKVHRELEHERLKDSKCPLREVLSVVPWLWVNILFSPRD